MQAILYYLQSVNFFVDKGIQQHITDGTYVYITCNDQGSSANKCHQ